NMTLGLPPEVEEEIKRHPEIKWTHVAREALIEKAERMRKLDILEKYLDKNEFSDEDLRWMEEHDWHPVDEKRLKREFVSTLEKTRKGSFKKISSLEELG
ncbi:MAG: hypothetical protein AB1468_01880, partial [Candidatus Micrarchaeota archaeon]